MLYLVKTTCYFDGRLFEKGELVELNGDVPEHLEPQGKAEPEKEQPAKRRKKD